jgi:hypothetical protein
MDLEADDLNDETDEEDWSAMGPDALRDTRRGPRREYRDYNYLSRTQTSNPRYRSVSAQAHSLPQGHTATPVLKNLHSASRGNHVVNAGNPSFSFTAPYPSASPPMAGTGAERDAIEALIAMGSM